jgi:hypothetical protein
MRKLMVVLCALFVLSGCGTVAKEIAPQVDAKSTTAPASSSANVSVIQIMPTKIATGNIPLATITVSENRVTIDVSSNTTSLEALLAAQSDTGTEVVPDGVAITVERPLAKTAETLLQGDGDMNQVYVPGATELFVAVDPDNSSTFACAVTQSATIVY